MRGDCECWRKWQLVRQASCEVARDYCCANHSFACWDRKKKLGEFLFDAIVGGSMVLDSPPRAKDFRRSILGKREFDPPPKSGPAVGLEAGPAICAARNQAATNRSRSITTARLAACRRMQERSRGGFGLLARGSKRTLIAVARPHKCVGLTSAIRPLAEEILEQLSGPATTPAHQVFGRSSRHLEMLGVLADFESDDLARKSRELKELVTAFNAVLDRLDFYVQSAWPRSPRRDLALVFLPEDRADLLIVAAMPLKDREKAARTPEGTSAAFKQYKLTRERLRCVNRRLLHAAYERFLRLRIGCGRLWFGKRCLICSDKTRVEAGAAGCGSETMGESDETEQSSARYEPNWLPSSVKVWVPSETRVFSLATADAFLARAAAPYMGDES